VAVLHLDNVPDEVYDQLWRLALAHRRTPEEEAVDLLTRGVAGQPPGLSQAELLAEMRRRSFTPPPGTPDSVELLAEDRGR
jgi:plasmid stability protein